MSVVRASLLPFSALLLAACSTTHPAAPKPVAPVAQQAAPQTLPPTADGVYFGTSTRFRADRQDCPHPGLVTLVVQDQQFEYRWNRDLSIEAVIDPDGSVHGDTFGITLTGQVDGQTMSGDVTNSACALHFTVRRQV